MTETSQVKSLQQDRIMKKGNLEVSGEKVWRDYGFLRLGRQTITWRNRIFLKIHFSMSTSHT